MNSQVLRTVFHGETKKSKIYYRKHIFTVLSYSKIYSLFSVFDFTTTVNIAVAVWCVDVYPALLYRQFVKQKLITFLCQVSVAVTCQVVATRNNYPCFSVLLLCLHFFFRTNKIPVVLMTLSASA
jgi:hypothetical protein